jgi:ribonuclease J
MARPDELTFAPLGGVGEDRHEPVDLRARQRNQRSWLAVDLGVSLATRSICRGST